MHILLAVDGSTYTKRMLAYLATHSELFASSNTYTVLTVQQDERNLVGASPSATLFIRKGLLSSADFQGELEGEANQSFLGMFYLGGLLLFLAFMSLMMPHAKRFDLRPHVNAQGALAVLIVSASGSFLVMTFFFLLSLTR